MIASTEQQGTGRQAPDHPLDRFVADPSGLPPLCDEPEFAAFLAGMVADEAPRLFAVVQEYGERVDGSIVAWGMDFGDHAELVGGGVHGSLRGPEAALRLFDHGSHIRARLVWVDPAAATPTDDEAG